MEYNHFWVFEIIDKYIYNLFHNEKLYLIMGQINYWNLSSELISRPKRIEAFQERGRKKVHSEKIVYGFRLLLQFWFICYY